MNSTMNSAAKTGDAMRLAVILPCHNEAAVIADVVRDFQAALPEAHIFVYDNASTDETADQATRAGAEVRFEGVKGKGNAMRRAFADIDADIYLMADGDGTYDAKAARALINVLIDEGLDMVVGARRADADAAYRAGHAMGNQVFSYLFRRLFRSHFTDVFSGYRVFSRRFVKSFPLNAKGFDIEIEMATHSALLRLPTKEMPTSYGARAAGSASKLRTWRDGFAILRRMFRFLRLHRPRFVYGILAMMTGLNAMILVTPVLLEYLSTGLVPRFPTLIVSVALMVAAVIFFVVGVILDAQAQNFAEMKRLVYLQQSPPARGARRTGRGDRGEGARAN